MINIVEFDDPALRIGCDVYASLDNRVYQMLGTAHEAITEQNPFHLPIDLGLNGQVIFFKFSPFTAIGRTADGLDQLAPHRHEVPSRCSQIDIVGAPLWAG